MTTNYSSEAAEIANAMNAVYENKQVNKKNDISGDFSTDDASYPTVQAVKSAISGKANTSHTHSTGDISDSNSYVNLNVSANSTQTAINTAINTAFGNITNLKAIEVTTDKGTASADTMGRLYIVSENSKVNVYYTERSGSNPNYTYTWKKMDTDILDELSISWNDVQSKPASFTPASHTHGNITNAGAIGSTANLPVITTTSGVLTTGAFGTSSGQFAEGNHTHTGYASDADIVSEVQSFASALANAINPSSQVVI